MAAMSESKYFAAGQVSALREAATAAVEAPCSLTLETLAQVEPLHIPEGSFPAWAAHVCEAREHFRNAAFMILGEDGLEAYAFLYAKQKPRVLTLLALTEWDGDQGAYPPKKDVVGPEDTWAWQFYVSAFVTERQVGVEHADEMLVLPGLLHCPDMVKSHCDPIPIRHLPARLASPCSESALRNRAYSQTWSILGCIVGQVPLVATVWRGCARP